MTDEPKVRKVVVPAATSEPVVVEAAVTATPVDVDTTAIVETTTVVESAYPKEELDELTRSLGQVVLGAAMSEKSGAFGLMREIVAAMKASAVFVGDSTNPLLREVVSSADPSTMDDVDKDGSDSTMSAEKAVEDGIAAAKRSHELLVSKDSNEDADAWAQLLLTAANAAVESTKTGGFLGFGGEKVTASEQAYMQRLADTLGYKKNA